MAFHGYWPKELEKRLRKHAKNSENDRGKFKELVTKDKVLMKEKTWRKCDLHARRMGLYEGLKLSPKEYPFESLGEEKKKKLGKLLADNSVSWFAIEADEDFANFTRDKMRFYAKHREIKINKKEADKAYKTRQAEEQAKKDGENPRRPKQPILEELGLAVHHSVSHGQ